MSESSPELEMLLVNAGHSSGNDVGPDQHHARRTLRGVARRRSDRRATLSGASARSSQRALCGVWLFGVKSLNRPGLSGDLIACKD